MNPVRTRTQANTTTSPLRNRTPAIERDSLATVAGNMAMQALLRSGIMRAKLAVGGLDDPEEREADVTADRIMRLADGSCCSSCGSGGSCEDETARRKPDGAGASTVSRGAEAQIRSLTGRGENLSPHLRTFYEPRLGRDLSHVRVHHDAAAADSARGIGARAYTLGSNIAFASGQWQPDTNSGRQLIAHELAHVSQGHSTSRIRRSWYDPFVDAAEWVGGKVESAGEAVWDGTKWVAGKVYAGGKWIYNTAKEKLGAAWRCAKGIGGSIFDAISPPDDLTLAEVAGYAQPTTDERPSSVIETITGVLKNPCVQMLPGSGLLLSGVNVIAGVSALMNTAWEIYKNPEPYIARIQESLGGMIGTAAEQAKSVATGSFSNENLDCVLRHLNPKLTYMRNNWWPILKDMAWELVWPWPGVKSDFEAIWERLKSMGSNLWDLEFDKAADDGLAILRHLNAAAGRLYGWFLIGSVLVGAILGGVAGAAAGGVGAVPGALVGASSGFAFASEVGYALLIATIAIEGASLLKASYNLSQPDRSPTERECDCELIASSSITLGVTGAMAILGAIAARFAKAILQRIANELFDRPPSENMARGRLVEARITLRELIQARFKARAVTVTDRLTPRGLLTDRGGNFPGIDLARDAQVTIRSQGQPINSAADLRAAMNSGQTINVDVSGGRIISVRSRGGANVLNSLENDIDELASLGPNPRTVPSFVRGVRSTTVTITNPTARVLVGVYEPGSLSAADIASLQNFAAPRGVTLELNEGIPTDPIVATTIDSMPAVLAEIANEATEVADDQQQGPAPCKL